jgi:hypothetical protein
MPIGWQGVSVVLNLDAVSIAASHQTIAKTISAGTSTCANHNQNINTKRSLCPQ